MILLAHIHKFTYKDKRLVLDVESGALHELDQPAWRALELLENGVNLPDAGKMLAAEVGEAAAAGAMAEISLLVDRGLLWSAQRQIPEGSKPVVKALCLFATDSCNLSCRYCFVNNPVTNTNNRSRGSMSAAVGRAAIDFLLQFSGQRRHCEIDYFGGEPLLNWTVLQEITAYAREVSGGYQKEISFTLTTNGLLLTAEIAAYLEKESFAAVLSIDGRPRVHDRMRPMPGGQGSYRETLGRIQSYTSKNPQGGYYVRGTYTRYNLDFCKDIEHLYRQGFRNISMEPVVTSSAEDHALREADLPRLEREYEHLVEFYLDCVVEGDPFNFFHFAIDLEQGPCLPKRMSGCGAGRDYLAVTPDGSIYPCHQLTELPGMKMGRVQEPEKFNGALPGDFTPSGPLVGSCRQCWARYYCGGGCRAASYLNGNPAEPYPLECALQRKRLECALYIRAVESEKVNR